MNNSLIQETILFSKNKTIIIECDNKTIKKN